MAYNLENRFPRSTKYYRFYDPGTFQYEKPAIKPNSVPFLSKSPRKTATASTLWTETIYNTSLPHSIPNPAGLKSKVSRFPYEAFSAEDLEAILCRCGTENPCSCTEPGVEEEICQRDVKRRIFKGSVSSGLHENHKKVQESPPFYDARVNESTRFYQRCKWSQRTSKRPQNQVHSGPGPASYTLDREPNQQEICEEKARELKRKTCKQLRFIEKVQLLNISEGRPGPGAYSPEWPKGTTLQFLGPKAPRFTEAYHVYPGPADHWLHRDFDLPDPPEKLTRAPIPGPSCFRVNANRFKPLKEQGPSPASYDIPYNPCRILRCTKAPFGSTTQRFKQEVLDSDDDDNNLDDILCPTDDPKVCSKPTWGFKSKTIRIKPIVKTGTPYKAEEEPKQKKSKPLKLQVIAPFNTSEGRFQPWNCELPVFGRLGTPGPCYYSLEVPKCQPAFHHGPLYRAERFPRNNQYTPAPNEYKTFGGIETILKTYNTRLINNINNQHKFVWEPPKEKTSLTLEQREMLLFRKCIDLLEPEDTQGKKGKDVKRKRTTKDSSTGPSTDTRNPEGQVTKKPKMLRSFLYAKQMPNCA